MRPPQEATAETERTTEALAAVAARRSTVSTLVQVATVEMVTSA